MKSVINDTTAQALKNVAMIQSQTSSGIWLIVDGINECQRGVMEGISTAKVSMSSQRFWRFDLDPFLGRVVGADISAVWLGGVVLCVQGFDLGLGIVSSSER